MTVDTIPPHRPQINPPSNLTSIWQPVWEIIRFELQESLHTRFLYIAFGIFFTFAFLNIHLNGTDWIALALKVSLPSEPGQLIPYVNSPLEVMQAIAGYMTLLMIVVAGIFAARASKDFACNLDGLLFTSPLQEWQYITGRLMASFLISLLISLSLGLALMLGQALPWMDGNKIGPFNLLGYIHPYLYLVIPNLMIFGIFSFGVGLLTRRTLPGYLSIVGLMFAANLVHQILSVLNASDFLQSLVDPFGAQSISHEVQFWTAVQRNTLNVPFAPTIWLSRLLFLGLSLVVFVWVTRHFRFSKVTATRPHPRLERLLDWGDRWLTIGHRHQEPEPGNPTVGAFRSRAYSLHLSHGFAAQFRHIGRIAQLEVKQLLRNPLFLVVLGISILLSVTVQAFSLNEFYGTPVLPLTDTMIRAATSSMLFLGQLLIIFLAGDLVWQERDVQIQPLTDPLPIRSWALTLGKVLALVLILVLVLGILMAACIITQTINGYTHYELEVYLIGLFSLTLVDLILTCILTITIQVLVNQKFSGYFLSAALIIGLEATKYLPPGLQIPQLLRYGDIPVSLYSQINGYGRTLIQVRWFQAYWLAIATLFLGLATLFWVRGIETSPSLRWRIARQRFTRPLQWVMALSAIAALGLGSWIFYNTAVLNPRYGQAQVEAQSVIYEKTYSYLATAQPKVTALHVNWDLYPEEPRIVSRGTYTLENKTQTPITTILLNTDATTQVQQLAIAGINASKTLDVANLRVHQFGLPTPLPPGKTIEVQFDLTRAPQGFTDEQPQGLDTRLVENGTFLNREDLLPTVGYAYNAVLTDNKKREQAGLPKRDPNADVPNGRQLSLFAPDGDRIQYAATISTAPDQIAVTTGNLVREWTEGNRRYFQYQSQVPILNFVALVSARYQVLRDTWNGIAIEIYYYKGHDRNLQRILRGAQKALAYYTTQFGPYPHQSLRILEFPYGDYGQSYPGNISFGEGVGFLARVNDNDPNSIDYAFYVTAHEVAHQWWGHQITPSFTQGANILSESLAEYSALQVLQTEYGPEKLRVALRQNLKVYLSQRSQSDVPLVQASEQHLIYQKGSLVMYALQDYLGEEVVNRALASFLQERSQVPPYPTAQDLVTYLQRVTPREYQYLLTDMFETVTLYDNQTETATWTQRRDGLYDVTLTLSSKKVRSDKNGNETPVEMNDDIDVGVFNTQGKLIYLKKHRFLGGKTTLTFTVDEQPYQAGIDPLHKLVDVISDDNVAPAVQI